MSCGQQATPTPQSTAANKATTAVSSQPLGPRVIVAWRFFALNWNKGQEPSEVPPRTLIAFQVIDGDKTSLLGVMPVLGKVEQGGEKDPVIPGSVISCQASWSSDAKYFGAIVDGPTIKIAMYQASEEGGNSRTENSTVASLPIPAGFGAVGGPSDVISAVFFERALELENPVLSGEDVVYLQFLLKYLGYDSVGAIDGIFGAKTDKALRQFQTDQKIPVNGQATVNLINRLFQACGNF